MPYEKSGKEMSTRQQQSSRI